MSSREIIELEKDILYHNVKYWVDSDPLILDEEYDLLIERLKAIHPESDIFKKLEEQKSQENQHKYIHSDPMLSLEKFYSKEKVFKWMENIGRSLNEMFKLQLKLDGISGGLENCNLATRGDGRVGENHTEKIPFMDFIFSKSREGYEKTNNTVRGEIIIMDEFFKKNLKGEYKNSRNAVAGLVGRKTAEKIKGMGVTFVDFDYDELSFTGNIDAIMGGWDGLVKSLTSKGFPYDGLVIKLADVKYYRELGNKTKTPRGAIAYKFANKSAITTVKDISWQVSRTGKLTPVCLLEPVELAGVTISRATAHNYENVLLKNITSNAVVKIERAGDVIPYLAVVIKSGISGIPISDCPCCGATTIVKGVDLYCTNNNCPDRLIENLVFIAKTIGIDELGRPTAEKLYNLLSNR